MFRRGILTYSILDLSCLFIGMPGPLEQLYLEAEPSLTFDLYGIRSYIRRVRIKDRHFTTGMWTYIAPHSHVHVSRRAGVIAIHAIRPFIPNLFEPSFGRARIHARSLSPVFAPPAFLFPPRILIGESWSAERNEKRRAKYFAMSPSPDFAGKERVPMLETELGKFSLVCN